ncbi:recombinase family protein [Streptomyces sp. NPDC017615]|uniref:recombinase family protein n=1 Tax=Streptomyces sp. NPDC017615 TaxID=3365003 RepID=UPI00379A3E78
MTSPLIPDTFHGSPTDEDGEPWLAYIRVSTWKEEKISPELQREAISGWAKRTGRRIIGWVEDLDVSGRHFRRKITGCVERCEAGEARGVAVWRYSRFGRDRTGNALWLARLQQAGGELESATEPIDASTAIGRLQRGMILEFGVFESDRAGEQWRETHQHRKYKLGLPAQGRKRFGYIWHRRWNAATETLQKEQYEINEDLGPTVAQLYKDYVKPNGDGFTVLAGRLNAAGHRTTQETLWTTETLTRYMDSGFAAGLLHVHAEGCRCRKTDGSCRNKVYIQGAHEELIDFDLWTKYQQRRKEVRETAPRSRKGLYELTSLVKHDACQKGTSLNASEGKPGFAYRCSLRAKAGPLACEGVYVLREQVEEEVLNWLKREAADDIDAAPPTDLDDDQAPTVADQQAANIKARARAQADVDKQRDALARLRADWLANPEEYEEGEYEDAAKVIRDRRDKAQAVLDNTPEVAPLPDRAEFTPIIVGLLAEWKALDVSERNGLYRALIRRVVLIRHGAGSDNAEVVVHPKWKPDPWLSEIKAKR